MASAFALPPAEIEAEVLELVRSGEIAARVDAWAGVLERDGVGEREGVFRKALVEGERAEAETVRAIVRMRLYVSRAFPSPHLSLCPTLIPLPLLPLRATASKKA